jgi:hypothetical protein
MANYGQVWSIVTSDFLLWSDVVKHGPKNRICGVLKPIFPILKQWALGTHFLHL